MPRTRETHADRKLKMAENRNQNKKTALAGEGGEGKMYSAGTVALRIPQSSCGFCPRQMAFCKKKYLRTNPSLEKTHLVQPIVNENVISN
jgi:hypothetical protein